VAILIVEDEPLLRMDISDDLALHGYEVLQAGNADDAIKILEARDDIRTIFTDIGLPGSTDGLKLAAAVRGRWPPINIIITTGMKAPHADHMPVRSQFVESLIGTPKSSKQFSPSSNWAHAALSFGRGQLLHDRFGIVAYLCDSRLDLSLRFLKAFAPMAGQRLVRNIDAALRQFRGSGYDHGGGSR
jgi:CheY-like chemotaxis protein